ncbi:HlyD family efflux transporter periplasmic adaptor subunit [Xylophilus sp. Kf1]|nr:HlyD family efflux transporter periplasmic adaptor subunit [Xylophilus sp. Kf1]
MSAGANSATELAPDALTLVRALQSLRRRSPAEPGYWDEYAGGLRHLCRARRTWVCEADAAADDGWRVLGSAGDAAEGRSAGLEPEAVRDLHTLAPRAADKGFAVMPTSAAGGVQVFRLVVRLESAQPAFALVEISQRERATLNELVLRAQLVADLPAESAALAAGGAVLAPAAAAVPATAVVPATPVPPPPVIVLPAGPPVPPPATGALVPSGGAATVVPSVTGDMSFSFASPTIELPKAAPAEPAPQVAASADEVTDALAEPVEVNLLPAVGSASMTELLALAAQVQREERSGAALLTLVNGLAAVTGAAQVAIGWAEAGRVRAATISHLDRFDAAADLVELIESALDESLEHEVVLRTPAPPQARPAPALARLGDALGFPSLCALALRQGSEPASAAVLFAFSAGRMLDDASLARVRSMLDLVLPRLAEMRARERWWGLRLRDAARRQLATWMGPRHVWLKALAVATGLFLVYAAFGRWDYRIDGNGQLTTDSTRVLAAAYDGRIESAEASAGDLVTENQLLATLDTRELRQQQNDAQAEVHRYTAEADKARAGAAWAEMEIAQARQQQAEARLARVQDMTAQALVRAPFDGVLVEGERKDLLGAPVKKGDKLFRVARIESLYVMATVPENEIPLVPARATGQFTLVSDPDHRIPLRIVSVIPVAQTKGQEGNQFMMRAELLEPPAAWWRPGMSGAVRIDAGRRNVAWILTHRLVDKIRLLLWW